MYLYTAVYIIMHMCVVHVRVLHNIYISVSVHVYIF